MKANMGMIDRLIRLIIASVLAYLYFTGAITGLAGTIALVIAAVFVLTSLVSFCPLYRLIGLSTRKRQV